MASSAVNPTLARAAAPVPSPARSLPAGVADIALASVTSFMVGIDAARHLDAVSLGLWGMVFSAYLLASIVPHAFLLTPFEAALVAHPPDQQLRAAPRTMTMGFVLGLPASMLAMALAMAFSPGLSSTTIGRFFIIGVVLGVTSPLQDHARRLLHQVGWSNGAALVALVQAVVALTCVVGLRPLGVSDLYVPPLSLALSNAVSLAFARVLARRRAGPGPAAPVELRKVMAQGGWLLGAGIVDRATHFACLALISLWIGVGGVGEYEATRVAAQPVLVFALGVLSVYRRQIMSHALERHRQGARRTSLIFNALVLGATLAYTVPVTLNWSVNPLRQLIPAAYQVDGFLLAVLIATAIAALAMAPTTELIGSGLARAFARQLVVLSVAMVAVCFVALWAGVGVFAWPIAYGGRSLFLTVQLRRASRAIYRPPSHPEDPNPVPPLHPKPLTSALTPAPVMPSHTRKARRRPSSRHPEVS